MSEIRLRDDRGRGRYWWSVLAAVPSQKDSWPYRRLRRVWFDHTWANHPFLEAGSELHMTAALFENFTILDPAQWIPQLLNTAGLRCTSKISAAKWGYEILDPSSRKMADVAIHYRDESGDGLIIIEAKKKGGRLKSTDVDPSSYLDLEAFNWAPQRRLIYLIDESDLTAVRSLVADVSERSGIVTWQALGGLQIKLALELRCDEKLRSYVAGSIQQQFLAVDVLPTFLSAPYLSAEPPREKITKTEPDRMNSTDWSSQEWLLPPSE